MQLWNKIKTRLIKSEYFIHETKRSALLRFLLIVLIATLYFILVSFEYGLEKGFMVALLTWTFFIFCTPIADAGFLVGVPLRLLAKIRMIYSQIAAFIVAFFIDLFTLIFDPNIYEKTGLLKLFKHIILTPYPFWIIIILSVIGTFLSIYFGDELIDVAKHKDRTKYKKHKNKYISVLVLFVIVLTILLYSYLMKKMGINLPF